MQNYTETQLEPREKGAAIAQRRPLVASLGLFNFHLSLDNGRSFIDLCCRSTKCMLPNFRVKPSPHWQASISSSIK